MNRTARDDAAMDELFGAIEGGGTKFVCAVGRGPDDIVSRVRVETTSPDETLGRAIEALRAGARAAGAPRLGSVGIAMFGPLELRTGRTLATPKPGWNDVPVLDTISRALGVPAAIDTDVNAAALAEWRWGAARDADPVAYLTIGTGIGGGVLVRGVPLHGLMHPEIGHISVPVARDREGRPDDFAGVCPFHGRCLEGVASGTALRARTTKSAADISTEDRVWDLEATYLAHAVATCVLVVSPERVVLGGGVMQKDGLLARVREAVPGVLAGYVPRPELTGAEGVAAYVVAPRFGQDAGLAGAFALAAGCILRQQNI